MVIESQNSYNMHDNERFLVRIATGEDMDCVRRLVLGLYDHNNMQTVPRIPTTEDLTKELTRQNANQKRTADRLGLYTQVAIDLWANKGQQVIGYIMYSRQFSIQDGINFYLTSFFISEDHRRHGIGKKLMAALERHLKSIGGSQMFVGVMNNNPGGHRFYKQFGFEQVNDKFQLLRKDF